MAHNLTQIVENNGILLHVEYRVEDDIPHFRNVRVVDGNYRPVGPNLVGMLHETLVMVSGELEPTAERFLSSIATEL